MRTPVLLLVSLAMATLGAVPVEGGEQRIVLQDHINREWKRELVSFPVKFERGACRADSLVLRGPEGPMPCQLTDVGQFGVDTEFYIASPTDGNNTPRHTLRRGRTDREGGNHRPKVSPRTPLPSLFSVSRRRTGQADG